MLIQNNKKIKKVSDMNENQEQEVICSWCLQNNLIPVAVVNGFNLNGVEKLLRINGLSTNSLRVQNAIQIKKLKKQGMHTGFPDMMIFGEKNNNPAIMFLENKVKKNTTSDIQDLCHEWLSDLGFTIEISRDSIDAIKKIKNFFDLENNVQKKNKIYLEKRKVQKK